MSTPTGSGPREGRTRTFSLRLTEAEHAKIRELANRLGSNEATVIRYAIRSMLNRVAPLHDPNASGFSLLPVFVECGAELTSYFELDVTRLDQLINDRRSETDQRVETDDLMLLSMSNLGKSRVHAKLRELMTEDIERGEVDKSLQDYFYVKYIYRTQTDKTGD